MVDVEWQSKRKRAGRDVEIAMSGVPTLPNPAIHFLPSRRPPDYAPLDTLNLTIGRTNFLRVTCHLPSNPMAFELILVSSRWDRKYRKFNQNCEYYEFSNEFDLQFIYIAKEWWKPFWLYFIFLSSYNIFPLRSCISNVPSCTPLFFLRPRVALVYAP